SNGRSPAARWPACSPADPHRIARLPLPAAPDRREAPVRLRHHPRLTATTTHDHREAPLRLRPHPRLTATTIHDRREAPIRLRPHPRLTATTTHDRREAPLRLRCLASHRVPTNRVWTVTDLADGVMSRLADCG